MTYYKNDTDGYFVFRGNSLVVPAEFSETELCHPETFRAEIMETSGAFAGEDFFEIPPLDGGPLIRAVALAPDFPLSPEWKPLPVRRILDMMAAGSIFEGTGAVGRLLRACHVSLWRGESRFCGSCGSKNSDADNGELARECPVCGRMEFPRICPAVITVITNGKDEALLAHNRKFSPGLYSLIAGFNEAGEDLESTVAREIREEVGIEVKDIQYIRSQPWPFPNSLMIGFSASYASGEIHPDGIEIEEAKWFKKDDLPQLPGRGSVSRYLIELWREGKLPL